MTEALYTVNSIVRRVDMRKTAGMNHGYLSIVALCALVACGPVSTYYKPGVSVSRLDTDRTNCQVSALSKAPVANQIRREPPVFVQGRLICNKRGQCARQPGYWIDGDIYTVDVNAGLRDQVTDMCMAEKGYEPVSIPRCSQNVVQAAQPRQTVTLPTLTASSCVIPYKDGRFQIVNPVTTASKS